MFAGHTDVVPVGDEAAWTQGPFSAEIVDGEMYGRGAVDMKGGIACFVSAMARLIERKGATEGLGVAADHRRRGRPGDQRHREAAAYARDKGETWDAAVVGEPTNPAEMGDMIKIGRRGSLSGTLTVDGVQGHVAYPHLADNPLRGHGHAGRCIARPAARCRQRTVSAVQPGDHQIDTGNTATNVIPARTSARFNIRFNDMWSAESLKRTNCAPAWNGPPDRPGSGPDGIRCATVSSSTSALAVLPDTGRCADRCTLGSGQGSDRTDAGTVDHRRHIGCAVHQGLLPGRRVRSCRQDHAHGRRTRRAERSRKADGDLRAVHRTLVRTPALKGGLSLAGGLVPPRLEAGRSLAGLFYLILGNRDGLRLFDLSARRLLALFRRILLGLAGAVLSVDRNMARSAGNPARERPGHLQVLLRLHRVRCRCLGASGTAAAGRLPVVRHLCESPTAGHRQQLVRAAVGLYRVLPAALRYLTPVSDTANAFISLGVYAFVIWLYYRVVRISVEGDLMISIFITLMMVMTGLTISEIAFSALTR
jgi:succinyl-diaminopimelate desuccinylase